MSRRAMEGTCLAALVRMAIPRFRAAEQQCPRTGAGRPPDYEDWKIALLIMVAVIKKRKSKSAQYRYLHQHRREFMTALELRTFPARSTYFDRYRKVHRLFEVAIYLQGWKAIAEGVADPKTVAVDQSLIEARGPQWNWRARRMNQIPDRLRGVDRDCGWGFSPHHGWVHGYAYEVVVTASTKSTVFPLLASVHPANVSEHKTFPPKAVLLHGETRYVLADTGYDSKTNGDPVEYDRAQRPTGRRFVCPPNSRGHVNRKPKSPPKKRLEQAKQRRRRRIEFYKSKMGQKLSALRGRTIEPFNEWFKSLFELDEHVWHRGLGNNQTQILAAVFGYQLLVRYNRRRGRENGQIRWILDVL